MSLVSHVTFPSTVLYRQKMPALRGAFGDSLISKHMLVLAQQKR